MGMHLRQAPLPAAIGLLLVTSLLCSGAAVARDGDDDVTASARSGLESRNADGGRGMRSLTVELKGPVTRLNPLQVLGQRIEVGHDTVWLNTASSDVLRIGDEVEINGLHAGTAVRATRIEYKPKGQKEWKLMGYVTHLHRHGVDVGAQPVALNTSTRIRDCPGSSLRPGQWVEVKAVPRVGFYPGDPVMASRVECKAR